MTRTITDEQIERLGKISQRAFDYLNCLRYSADPMMIQNLKDGLRFIKDEAEALYRELGGEEEQQ